GGAGGSAGGPAGRGSGRDHSQSPVAARRLTPASRIAQPARPAHLKCWRLCADATKRPIRQEAVCGAPLRMNRRISLLVASGFTLLLGLGLLVSVIMTTGLRETVIRADASQASALEVRAAIRSLRADYLEGADAVSRLLFDPAQQDARAVKR